MLEKSTNMALALCEQNVRMCPSIWLCHRPIVRMSMPKELEDKKATSIFVAFSLIIVLESFSLMNRTTTDERERLQLWTREIKRADS